MSGFKSVTEAEPESFSAVFASTDAAAFLTDATLS